jgi:hypothetical protein
MENSPKSACPDLDYVRFADHPDRIVSFGLELLDGALAN